MEQSIHKRTAGQNKATGDGAELWRWSPGGLLPGLRWGTPTLQLTALSHKKDINLESFFHCQSSTMLFPAPSVAEVKWHHASLSWFSFLSFFFLPLVFLQSIIKKTWFCPSYAFLPRGTCLSGAPNMPRISRVPPATQLGDKAP